MSVEQLLILESELRDGGEIEYGYFDKYVPPDGWELVEKLPADPYKVKLINNELGLFAIVFAPVAYGYGEKLAKTLSLLASFGDLSVPVLVPITYKDGVILFHLGEFKKKGRLEDLLSADDIEKMEKAIRANGLEPLSQWGDRIVIVEVDGDNYLVDPVDDSNASIFDAVDK